VLAAIYFNQLIDSELLAWLSGWSAYACGLAQSLEFLEHPEWFTCLGPPYPVYFWKEIFKHLTLLINSERH